MTGTQFSKKETEALQCAADRFPYDVTTTTSAIPLKIHVRHQVADDAITKALQKVNEANARVTATVGHSCDRGFTENHEDHIRVGLLHFYKD